MTVLMSNLSRRFLAVVCTALALAGCGNRETKEALQKSQALQDQKDYQGANTVLIQALRARESQLRNGAETPSDPTAADALTKKIEADPEILKMERAQIMIYLHLGRADLASAVYADILTGNPGDTVVNEALKDTDPVVRTGAVRVLGLTGKPESFDLLVAATKDPDKDVRRSAVAALGQMKDAKAVAPLIEALKDSYWFVRSDAADALGRAKDARAVEPLLDVVADPDTTTESSAESALVLLSRLPDAPKDVFAKRLTDPNPKIVRIAAICLAVLKDSRAIPVLTQLAASPDVQTRLNAIKALGETGDPSVIPTLRQTLKDPDVNMRGWSIISLGNLKDEGSVADLKAIAANEKETPNIRAAATAAVAHITGADKPAAPIPPKP